MIANFSSFCFRSQKIWNADDSLSKKDDCHRDFFPPVERSGAHLCSSLRCRHEQALIVSGMQRTATNTDPRALVLSIDGIGACQRQGTDVAR